MYRRIIWSEFCKVWIFSLVSNAVHTLGSCGYYKQLKGESFMSYNLLLLFIQLCEVNVVKFQEVTIPCLSSWNNHLHNLPRLCSSQIASGILKAVSNLNYILKWFGMFQHLKSGTHCFVAMTKHTFITSLPLLILQSQDIFL